MSQLFVVPWSPHYLQLRSESKAGDKEETKNDKYKLPVTAKCILVNDPLERILQVFCEVTDHGKGKPRIKKQEYNEGRCFHMGTKGWFDLEILCPQTSWLLLSKLSNRDHCALWSVQQLFCL